MYWVWAPDPNPKPKSICVCIQNFISIHFGIEINNRFKLLTPISLTPIRSKKCKKNISKYLENFFNNFQKSQKFLDPNIVGCQKF